MLFQAHKVKLHKWWLLCTREFQSVTALLCLNKDTSICTHIDNSCTPGFDTEFTVLQSIQKELRCVLIDRSKLEASHVASFSTVLSPHNTGGVNLTF